MSLSPVKLTYFYIPPTDGTTPDVLAERAAFIVLTQKNEAYRDSLRAAGYRGAVLQYIVASEAQGPLLANSTVPCPAGFRPLANQVSDRVDDFRTFIHPNESWFLHNGAGQRLYAAAGNGVYYHMNPGSPGWRKFATERMVADATTLGYDGIFLDNLELTLVKAARDCVNSDGVVKEYATDALFRDAWLGYLAMLSVAIRPTGQLWANMINDPNTGTSWNPYLTYLDGGMNESFALGYRGLTPARWDANIKQAESALASGKGVMAVSAGPKDDATKQAFALASYLMMAGPGAYFRYASNTNEHEYTSFWQYPNYDVALGQPTGARYVVDNGIWRRDFEYGFVTVNPVAGTSDIQVTSAPKPPDPCQPHIDALAASESALAAAQESVVALTTERDRLLAITLAQSTILTEVGTHIGAALSAMKG